MSVDPMEKKLEEDKSANLLSQPSTVDNTKKITVQKQKSIEIVNGEQENKVEDEQSGNLLLNVNSNQVEDLENFSSLNDTTLQEPCDIVEKLTDPISNVISGGNEKVGPSEDRALRRGSNEEAEASTSHGTKRSHQQESEEKMKSVYQLMGLMFDLKDTKKIRKASVCYKKRFSQIRFQNRILRLQKPPNKHIYFHDNDDELKWETATTFLTQDRNDSGELFEDASDKPTVHNERRKVEMEEFSEKDDSTDDDQDIFFSAEEENLDANQERKLKTLSKRRKKRQTKKRMISYPQEMVDNPKITKFWRRRYSLFSKYDEGIKMDAESWYSVTPEKIAVNIAQRCQCDLVIDAFCGAGGNAIQLAFTCERVIAIDIDPHKIELARHNARVYGVEDRIEFVVADYLQVAPTLMADAVFLSPPWGGPGYIRHNVFPLASLLPVSGQELFRVTSGITDNIAFYLPRNINSQELVECAGPGGCVEVVQNFLDRELIAVTAFFGELVNSSV